MRWQLFVIAVIIGSAYAEISTENAPNLPNIDEIEAIKERCNKKGGEGTYEKLKKAKDETQECIKNLIDVEKIKDEVEEAKKTGSMDEVFGKYCNKRPDLLACVRKTTNVAELCLEQNEKDALNTTIGIVEQIGDFVCYRDGDRIAMFIAEGGMECLNSRSDAIKKCVNETIKIDVSELDMNTIPNLSVTQEKCENIGKIQNCVVNDLEKKCDDTTPANIVDALFKFVKKVGCKSTRKQKRTTSTVTQSSNDTMKQWREKLKKTCEDNGGPDSFDKLESSLNTMKSCVKGKIMLLRTPKDKAMHLISQCSEEAMKALEKCLPSQAAYYPTMLRDTFTSLVEFAYNHQEIFIMNPNNMEILDCLRTLKSPEVQRKMGDCMEDIIPESIIQPKAEICRNTEDICRCISKLVKNTCVADVKINKLMTDFSIAIQKPCESE